MSYKRLSLTDVFEFYLFIVITLTIFNGILSNFAPLTGGLGVGTILLDTTLIFGVPFFIILSISSKFLNRNIAIYTLSFIFFAVLLILKSILDVNDFTMRLLGWRNYIIYALPFIFFLYLNRNQRRYTEWITILMTLICLFAITQYFFRDVYPDSFTKLKVENIEFGFYGTNIIRVNGLIGNTIIFTGFSLIAGLLNINLYFYTRKILYAIGFMVCIIAMFLTFSRAAWVIGTAVVIINYMIVIRLEAKRLIGLSLAIILSCALGFNWLVANTNSFIYRRLFSQEASTRGSDQIHTEQISSAMASLRQHPLLGVGLGTQGGSASVDTSIISDGWLLQAPLELGLPLTIVFSFMLIGSSIYGLRMMRFNRRLHNVLASTTASATLYFFMTGFLNSAFVGKTVYIIYFIILGLMISVSITQLREHHAKDDF